MQKAAAIFGSISALLVFFALQPQADASFHGLPKGLKGQLENLQLNLVLVPTTHKRECIAILQNCETPQPATAVASIDEGRREAR